MIREYLPGLKLRDVYWIHFEANDLMNVVDEMKNPILRRYTDSEFSQNLKRRQDEILNFSANPFVSMVHNGVLWARNFTTIFKKEFFNSLSHVQTFSDHCKTPQYGT